MKFSSLSSILLIIIMLYIVICGISFYLNHHVEYIIFSVYSVLVVLMMEILNNVKFTKNLINTFGNILLTLLDIILITYILGTIVYVISDIEFNKILDYTLIAGILIEIINLFSNFKKYSKFYPK